MTPKTEKPAQNGSQAAYEAISKDFWIGLLVAVILGLAIYTGLFW